MLRSVILAAARNQQVKRVVAGAPVSRSVVRRYVAGESTDDAVRVTGELVGQGLTVSLDHLGEDTADAAQAAAIAKAYCTLLDRLSGEGLAAKAEFSVKLSAVGQALPGDGERIALEHAREIAEAAQRAGTTVTLDMEDHTTTDSTLSILGDLRADYPATGAVLQAYLRRTEGDCRALAYPGSRVRLCKGAYDEPDTVAFGSMHEVDLSYVRCLNVLMAGPGYPMVASHDPRLIAIADERARWYGRARGSYEFQLLYGVRPDEQLRLAAAGETVRVYVPYGAEWYGYLMRRLAERPANVSFFLRSLVSRG
ncbi:MAG TPA: proline dehydrogenase family protein [Mycobacteriales bacterium]|nr:proline dehydrogenase family protein [Mycobacteriales bacterium]